MVKRILAQFCFFLFAFYSGILSSLSSNSISFPNAISLVNLSITFLTENKRICPSSIRTHKTLHWNPLSNLTFSHTSLFWASRKPHQIAYSSEGEISLFLSQAKMTSIVSGLPAERLIFHNQALLSALGSFLSKQNTDSFASPHTSMCLKHYMIVGTMSHHKCWFIWLNPSVDRKDLKGSFLFVKKKKEKERKRKEKKRGKKKFRAQSSYIVIGFMPICWGSKWTQRKCSIDQRIFVPVFPLMPSIKRLKETLHCWHVSRTYNSHPGWTEAGESWALCCHGNTRTWVPKTEDKGYPASNALKDHGVSLTHRHGRAHF